MNSELMPLNAVEIGFIGLYLLSLLLVGYFGFRAKKADTLQDFFLGGQRTGLWVLLLTLYATQYSGNTLFGFTGKTYRVGYACLLYTSPSPRDNTTSRMPSSA